MIHSPWFGTHHFGDWHLTSKGGPLPFAKRCLAHILIIFEPSNLKIDLWL